MVTESAQGQGQTDITPHVKTWHGFMAFAKWSAIGIALIMILLALFRTG
jgi:hypothetical protein